MEMATQTFLRLPVEFLLLLYREEMFSMHTVHEWLWGYKDRLLQTMHKLHPTVDPEFGFFHKVSFLFMLNIFPVQEFDGTMGSKSPPPPPKPSGWLLHRWGGLSQQCHITSVTYLELASHSALAVPTDSVVLNREIWGGLREHCGNT